MNELTVERIYARGYTVEDFQSGALKPNQVVVSPIRPPKKLGAILTTDEMQRHPGVACLLYTVVAVAEYDTDDATLVIAPGDVVILRNAMLDPLHPSQDFLVIDIKHVLKKMGDTT